MNQFKSNLPTNDKGSSSGKQNAHTNPMAPRHINPMALQTNRRRKGPIRFKQGSQVINNDKSTKWNDKLGSNGTTNKSPKEGTNKIQTRISSNQQ